MGEKERTKAFLIKEVRKERKRGQNYKKGCNDCCILNKKNIFHALYVWKEYFSSEYFPDITRKEYNPISKGLHLISGMVSPFMQHGYTLSGIRCSLITKKNVSFARKEGMLRGNTWFVLGKQTVCSGQIDHLFGKNRCLVWLKDRFLLKALLE